MVWASKLDLGRSTDDISSRSAIPEAMVLLGLAHYDTGSHYRGYHCYGSGNEGCSFGEPIMAVECRWQLGCLRPPLGFCWRLLMAQGTLLPNHAEVKSLTVAPCCRLPKLSNRTALLKL